MTELKKIALKTEFKRYFFMILGCFSYSLSLQMFLIPNKIVGGGVSGAASLINIMTGLPAGLFIVLINLPILFFGFKLMGWKFILRCFITTATLGLTTELLAIFVKPLTDNKILAAAYGGILQGVGIGLFIKYETSSGGTELLGRNNMDTSILDRMEKTDDFMYVLSNKEKCYGAYVILTEAARQEILNQFPNGKVTILPSSVHELILIETMDNENMENLQQMVREINQTELSKEDFLCDDVFHYDAFTGELTIAGNEVC